MAASMTSIAVRMRMFRAVNNLSQAEFAKKCGVAFSTISHIETDEHWPVGEQVRTKIEYVLMGGTVKPKEEKE